MHWNLQQVFTPSPIMGVTINTVFLHPAVRMFLFYLIAFVLVVGTIVLVNRKYRFSAALKKAAVIAFFVSGLAYAVHADIGWAQWLINDSRIYGGLDTEGKLLRMEGGLYDFNRRIKPLLPDTYQLYSSDAAFRWRTEYFLLPKRKKPNSEYIVVIGDNASRYDPVTRLFIREDARIRNVDMVFSYAENAYVLRQGK